MNPQDQFCSNKLCHVSEKRDERNIVIHSRLVITLLMYGCPRKAIEAAFDLAEQTMRDWERKAGLHCEQVHEQLIASQTLDLQQVQVDEIKVKTSGCSLWLAMAIMVPTRLWLRWRGQRQTRQAVDSAFS